MMQGILVSLLFIFPGRVDAQSYTDFSGSWVRNDPQSQPGPGISINSIPVTIDVEQQADALIIRSVSHNAKGETRTANDTLKFDGSASRRNSADGLHVVIAMRWSEDHKSFTTETSMTDEAGNVRQSSKKNWSLKDTRLDIENDFSYNGQTYRLVMIFDKKLPEHK